MILRFGKTRIATCNFLYIESESASKNVVLYVDGVCICMSSSNYQTNSCEQVERVKLHEKSFTV